ncbi:hypothetical protein SASPL_132767 [Salvia splendens]|uniref:Uncharacterized protein n=1 Tax=Salvia splendens TaxID=180675 RepID=A0A8X8X474_SALSN|nr:hypothetical protein SASPL_132767 [Salvia splendens]
MMSRNYADYQSGQLVCTDWQQPYQFYAAQQPPTHNQYVAARSWQQDRASFDQLDRYPPQLDPDPPDSVDWWQPYHPFYQSTPAARQPHAYQPQTQTFITPFGQQISIDMDQIVHQRNPDTVYHQDFQKDLEEQRVTDEKKGHFMGDRNQILSKSDQFSAPANASPSIVTDPMAAQSRVPLANHKAKALLSKNLVAILDEGGGEMNAENFGNLDCSKTSYLQIQNEEGRFDYHRLHAAENKGRIVASREGADSNSNLSNIREFNDNGELALGDPQSAEKDGSIMASHGETLHG